MDKFFKAAFLFSLLTFAVIFSLKFIFSKENNRIEVVEKSEASSFSMPEFLFEEETEASATNKETKAILSETETFPGEVLILKVNNAEEALIETSLAEGIDLYPDGKGNLNALVPVRYDKEPGEYALKIVSGDFSESLKVTVRPKDFPEASLDVPSQTAEETIENQKANAEYHEKVQKLKNKNEPFPLWSGVFKKPVEDYRLTSDFGEIRSVNGKASDRHGGIDMAAPVGTPVFSPANGKVIFSDFIALTGNTVMIEHGMGLKTLYYHMDSLNVKAGDEVKTGDMLGKIGTTGFSTGPHLHFAVAVENVYVDPWSFFEKDYRKLIDG